MVKADPKCDYYADLELPTSAEATEIKRQFKKLGMTASTQDACFSELTLHVRQLSNTTQIVIPAKSSSSIQNSKQSKPLTKYSPTLHKEPDMTLIEGKMASYTHIHLPHGRTRHPEPPPPISHHHRKGRLRPRIELAIIPSHPAELADIRLTCGLTRAIPTNPLLTMQRLERMPSRHGSK